MTALTLEKITRTPNQEPSFDKPAAGVPTVNTDDIRAGLAAERRGSSFQIAEVRDTGYNNPRLRGFPGAGNSNDTQDGKGSNSGSGEGRNYGVPKTRGFLGNREEGKEDPPAAFRIAVPGGRLDTPEKYSPDERAKLKDGMREEKPTDNSDADPLVKAKSLVKDLASAAIKEAEKLVDQRQEWKQLMREKLNKLDKDLGRSR